MNFDMTTGPFAALLYALLGIVGYVAGTDQQHSPGLGVTHGGTDTNLLPVIGSTGVVTAHAPLSETATTSSEPGARVRSGAASSRSCQLPARGPSGWRRACARPMIAPPRLMIAPARPPSSWPATTGTSTPAPSPS